MGRPGASEGSVDGRGQPGQLMAVYTDHSQQTINGHLDCSHQYQACPQHLHCPWPSILPPAIHTDLGHLQYPQPSALPTTFHTTQASARPAHCHPHCPWPPTLKTRAPGWPKAIYTAHGHLNCPHHRQACRRLSIPTDIYTAHGHLHC